MGAVIARKAIYDTFMAGPEHAIELFHGYTYSGHPLACAAGLAALEVYAEEGLFEKVRELAAYWEESVHGLEGLPHVVDIRNLGLIGAIELDPIAGAPAKRAFDVFLRAYEKGLLIRTTGDIVALSPPLTIGRREIDEIFGLLAQVLKEAR
jgi:beta-alanine--pyruvate transaminase